jgi:hypothetical protein
VKSLGKLSVLRLTEHTAILGGSPKQAFRDGSEGCKEIEAFDTGVSVVTTEAGLRMVVFPGGHVGLLESEPAK